MPAVRTGPLIGLIVQIVLLAALAMTVGLGAAGWLTGVGYGLVSCAALTRGLSRAGASTLGPADRVTLTRAILVGGVAALTVDSFDRQVPVGVLVALAVVALVLDAVDGQVARRSGTVSALGARFDMEVDAFLLLVLSVYVTPPIGAWVLLIGAMRYAFVGAIWLLPWMRGALPPRYWRKVVAATQGVVLVSATAGVLPRPLMAAALAASLALLVESFGRDVGWLWQHRPGRPATVTVLARGGSDRKPRRASNLPLNAQLEVLVRACEGGAGGRARHQGNWPEHRLPDTPGDRWELPIRSVPRPRQAPSRANQRRDGVEDSIFLPLTVDAE